MPSHSHSHSHLSGHRFGSNGSVVPSSLSTLTNTGSMKQSHSGSSIHSFASSLNILHAQDEELFAELNENGPLTIRRLQSALSEAGMHPNDPRLKQVHTRLGANPTDVLSLENFKYVIESASLLIYRALTRKLVIPDWHSFIRELDTIYRDSSSNTHGHAASYIPELANADPNTWAMAFCSVDGQQHGAGDISLPFSLQSTSKPLSYLMALEELGEDEVHRFVGREPSGRNFNELCLNAENIPHNPMINAGAIMVTSLIQHGKSQADRFGHILNYWKKLTGYSRDIAFSNTVYLSEKATANRNFCLAYLMQERGSFAHGSTRFRAPTTPQPPKETNAAAARIQELERQLREANEKLNPGHSNGAGSQEPPLPTQPASNVVDPLAHTPKPPREWKDTDLESNLDLYFQCCSIEATTQSMSVVAATLANGGVCPLTGERVFQAEYVKNALALMLSCGMYDYSGEWAYVVGLPAKSGVSGAIMLVIPNVGGLALMSPRLDELGNSARGIEFSRRLAKRFGLHFLGFKNKDAKPDTTPITAAPVVPIVATPTVDKGGKSGKLGGRAEAAPAAVAPASDEVPLIRKPPTVYQDLSIAFIFACAEGDMGLVRALIASAVDLNAADYDGRTPLHLAASNGHIDIVRVLILKGVDLSPVDRLGGTPLADAIREGHLEVVNLLRQHGAQLAEVVAQEEEFNDEEIHHEDEILREEDEEEDEQQEEQDDDEEEQAARHDENMDEDENGILANDSYLNHSFNGSVHSPASIVGVSRAFARQSFGAR